jgi:carbon storage regulator
MLVLTRHVGQEIVIGNDIRVVLLEVRGEQARIGIDAPPSVRVDRLEVQLRRLAAKEKQQAQEQQPALVGT